MILKNKTLIYSVVISIILLIIAVISTFLLKYNSNKKSNIDKDVISPIIVLNDVYAVKTGYNKNLVDVIMSADDIDRNPKREIIGEYDLNTEGEYNLIYKIEDSSGNVTKKDFKLKVKDDYAYKEDDIKYSEAIAKYKTENTKIGIDVSKWQSDINWEKVRGEGVEFAIIRMAYQKGFDGDILIDPYFEQNLEGCLQNNIPVAVYFSSYAKSEEESKSQAIWVKEYLENKKYTNLSVAFDWENWSSFNTLGLNLQDINNIANSFMDEIEKSNYKSILYGSKTYLEAVWENKNNYPVWLANYVEQTEYQGDYTIWQFCQTGIIDGISGKVDINVMYREQN